LRKYRAELPAVLFSLAYTVLITYDVVWCWPFAMVASLWYIVLCYRRRIYAESLLQLFYLGTAIYGWWNWGEGLAQAPEALTWKRHLGFIGLGAAVTVLSGYFLGRFTDAANFYVDSFTTTFSIIATLLMIHLYPANWLYFIIIDLVSIYLYASRKMYLTSGLFVLYTLLSVNGWIQWTQ